MSLLRCGRRTDCRPKSLSWLWVTPVILLTFALALHELGNTPLSTDERKSVLDAFGGLYNEPPRNPVEIWNGVAQRNPWHAPGYFIFLNAWGRLVGWSEFALRMSALLPGIVAVAVTYRIGRDWFSPRVGLYAALILGTSTLFIEYMHHLRVYTLFVLLTARLLWLYFRFVKERNPSVGVHWSGLVSASVDALYMHYFAALPLAAISSYHALFVRRDARWWKILAAFALAGVLFLPWFTNLLAGISRAAVDEERQAMSLNAIGVIQELGFEFSNHVPVLLLALGLSLFSLRDRAVRRIWFITIVVLLLAIVVNEWLRVIAEGRIRYLLGVWPLLALLAAVGLSRLQKFSPVILGGWVCIALLNMPTTNSQSFPWHKMALPFRDISQPGDLLVMDVPDSYTLVDAQDYQSAAVFYLDNSFVRVTALQDQPAYDMSVHSYQTALDAVEENDPLRVWIGYPASETSTLTEFRSLLENDYSICPSGLAHPLATFDLYTRSAVCCLPENRNAHLIRYPDGIHLTRMEALPATVDTALPVTLGWSVTRQIPPDIYSYGLYIFTTDDRLVAQTDHGLPLKNYSCQQTAIDTTLLSPGQYNLYVIVYAWKTGERLIGQMTTGEQGERLLLGRFRVAS
jgi:hypothetical protein